MQYIKRVVDLEIERKLEASGAVLIKGPKACGKTATAKQLAKSVLHLDQDPPDLSTLVQHVHLL